MYPLKNILKKKLLLLTSFLKRLKDKWLVGPYLIKNHYIIKKTAAKQKDRFSAFINKFPFLKKVIHFIKISFIKIDSKVLSVLTAIPFINKMLTKENKKYFGFLSAALAISLFIFYFMSLLISTGKNPEQAGSQNVNINFLLNAKLDEWELRSRRLPKKPKKEEPPPETPKLKIQQTDLKKPEMISQLPQLDLPDDFQSDQKGAGVSAYGSQDREVTPIFRIQPIYPRQAALRNIEGFVILQFDITPAGYTDNITVIQASPPQIFNSNAVQALKKWKYKAKIENGKPVRQNNLKVQLDFKLRDQ